MLSYFIVICVLYAYGYEFHQLFVPRRGGQVKDVIIDSMGSIVGITMHKLFILLKNKVKNLQLIIFKIKRLKLKKKNLLKQGIDNKIIIFVH